MVEAEYDSALAKRVLAECSKSLPQALYANLDLVAQWVDGLLHGHAKGMKPLERDIKQTLSPYYPQSLLDDARVVVVRTCPSIPFEAFGINNPGLPDGSLAAGITFLNTYFMKKPYAEHRAIHCHEMVHVVQWKILGAKAFIAAYAQGLLSKGYRDSPLEENAYDVESRFRNGEVFPVVPEVIKALQKLSCTEKVELPSN
jgi:hypothetical protein